MQVGPFHSVYRVSAAALAHSSATFVSYPRWAGPRRIVADLLRHLSISPTSMTPETTRFALLHMQIKPSLAGFPKRRHNMCGRQSKTESTLQPYARVFVKSETTPKNTIFAIFNPCTSSRTIDIDFECAKTVKRVEFVWGNVILAVLACQKL